MTPEQLREKLATFRYWYHKIDLGHGVVTPGLGFEPIWDLIRKVRGHIDYRGKKVLDIASFDGMWAFEAEKLGSDLVVATDCLYETFKNFQFCHMALGSSVVPFYNVSPYDLWNRLDVFLQENWEQQKPFDRLFDVVQHMGLLYHLRDPMLSLSQARSVIRTGGYLLLETACVANDEGSFMLFNGVPPEKPRIYDDKTTWWAPTVACIKDMLRASLFEPVEESVELLTEQSLHEQLRSAFRRYVKSERFVISRVAMVAKAVSATDIDAEYYRELARTFRNPGLVIEHLGA